MKKLFLVFLFPFSLFMIAQDCNHYLIQFQNEFKKKAENPWGTVGDAYGSGSKYDKSKYESAKKYVTYYLACKADEVGYDNATLSKLKNCIHFIYREDTQLIIAGEYSENKGLNNSGNPNLYYVINSDFKIVKEYDDVSKIYNSGDHFNDEIYSVVANNKKGIIDKYGNEIVAPQYDEISWYKEGKAVFKKNGKFGFINQSGTEIMPATYDNAHHEFFEGYLTVINGSYPSEKFGLVDKNGNEIIAPQYEIAGKFFGGLWPVYKDKKWGFVNLQNEVVIPFKFDMIGGSNGNFFGYTDDGVWYYVVQKNYSGKEEFMNKKGETFKTLSDVRN